MHLKELGRSFSHAWRGVRFAFSHERNFRIQVGIGIGLIIIMFLFPLARWERVVLLSMIMFVLVLELLNTSMEQLIDLAKPRLHEYVKVVKDVMAGAVLLAAVFAATIGTVILWPHVWGYVLRM